MEFRLQPGWVSGVHVIITYLRPRPVHVVEDLAALRTTHHVHVHDFAAVKNNICDVFAERTIFWKISRKTEMYTPKIIFCIDNIW